MRDIKQWALDPQSSTIFWLSGIAGTGKSTIAHTLAKEWEEQGLLGGTFFFSRSQANISSASLFCTTISMQLTRAIPPLVSNVQNVLERHPDIPRKRLKEQWKHLVTEPLAKISKSAGMASSWILIVDALDECESEKDAETIIELLAELSTIRTIAIRVLLTSRPELRIHSNIPCRDLVLHEIPDDWVRRDISIFFRNELKGIQEKYQLEEGWPGEERLAQLCRKSMGLFIYATTACLFISDKFSGQETYQSLVSRFQKVIGALSILRNSLPLAELSALIAEPKGSVSSMLRSLCSVLDADLSEKPIRMIHPAFRDFLFDSSRCSSVSQFHIKYQEAHDSVLNHCIVVMSNYFEQNFYPDKLRGNIIPPIELSKYQVYAIEHLVYHAEQAGKSGDTIDTIYEFLKKHFLFWLETLCRIKQVSRGISMMEVLERICRVSSTLRQHINQLRFLYNQEIPSTMQISLLTFVQDAQRFALNYRHIIERAPEQIYGSALMFSPKGSQVRQQFWHLCLHGLANSLLRTKTGAMHYKYLRAIREASIQLRSLLMENTLPLDPLIKPYDFGVQRPAHFVKSLKTQTVPYFLFRFLT